ncbi:DUF6133 family protein [Desulfosporosinus sp. OT]|uniref:DUF6133 family protein n=1 Tax=Desulfosporosinus sp. OT TaxID=913865 RepID=UPI000223A0D2|nr:DUF6133 family protein [Desulfosporosinus sp. OT]EGW41469.1 hypothetical protein DOT_0594 [Desulfosporosinus sp. OT]
MQNLINKVQVKTAVAIVRAKAALSNRSGQGALDTAIQVLISIVLGALILGGLYLILNATVLPTITDRIKDMFNYHG